MPVKVLVVGPQGSGKTCIANLLSESFNNPSNNNETPISLKNLPHDPTAGVRVLEVDVDLKSTRATRNWEGQDVVSVELWDCSGDLQYEQCWPALQEEVKGVLLVFNPENAGQKGQVGNWYEWFVGQVGLRGEQCLVFANNRESGHDNPRAKLPEAIDYDKTEVFYTRHDDQEKFTTAFQDFIGELGKYMNEEANSGEGKAME